MAMLVTICWGLQSVVGPGFTKVGGHKIKDACCLYDHTFINIITKTTRWEVVKNSASPKRPFLGWGGGGGFRVIFPIFRAFPNQASQIFWTPKRGMDVPLKCPPLDPPIHLCYGHNSTDF